MNFIGAHVALVLILLIIVYQIVISFFELSILTAFLNIKTYKYIKLLKILEILFFLMIFFGEILFIALTFLYFLVLISDFKKKIISKEELIINTLFYFTDILLIILVMLLILGNLPSI